MPSARPHSSPSQRSDSRPVRHVRVAAESRPADDQRVRESRVVVAQVVLEPAPVRRTPSLRAAPSWSTRRWQEPRLWLEPVGIDAREAEHCVRRRAERDLAVEGGDESASSGRAGPTTRRHPGRREHLAERPDRATDVVADMRLVEPVPFVAHEVAHARAVLVGRCVEKRERAVQDRRPGLSPWRRCELERDDDEPRDVVDAVAGARGSG